MAIALAWRNPYPQQRRPGRRRGRTRCRGRRCRRRSRCRGRRPGRPTRWRRRSGCGVVDPAELRAAARCRRPTSDQQHEHERPEHPLRQAAWRRPRHPRRRASAMAAIGTAVPGPGAPGAGRSSRQWRVPATLESLFVASTCAGRAPPAARGAGPAAARGRRRRRQRPPSPPPRAASAEQHDGAGPGTPGQVEPAHGAVGGRRASGRRTVERRRARRVDDGVGPDVDRHLLLRRDVRVRHEHRAQAARWAPCTSS